MADEFDHVPDLVASVESQVTDPLAGLFDKARRQMFRTVDHSVIKATLPRAYSDFAMSMLSSKHHPSNVGKSPKNNIPKGGWQSNR